MSFAPYPSSPWKGKVPAGAGGNRSPRSPVSLRGSSAFLRFSSGFPPPALRDSSGFPLNQNRNQTITEPEKLAPPIPEEFSELADSLNKFQELPGLEKAETLNYLKRLMDE